MKISQDSILGLFFVGTGAAAFLIARDYPFGTSGRMGAGYFPLIISGLMTLTGLLVVIRAFSGHSAAVEAIRWKSFVLVPGAILLFGLAVEPLGLFLAVLLLTVVSAAASVKFRLDWKAFVGAAAFSALCSIVFVKLLGLPMPIFGSWLQGPGL